MNGALGAGQPFKAFVVIDLVIGLDGSCFRAHIDLLDLGKGVECCLEAGKPNLAARRSPIIVLANIKAKAAKKLKKRDSCSEDGRREGEVEAGERDKEGQEGCSKTRTQVEGRNAGRGA